MTIGRVAPSNTCPRGLHSEKLLLAGLFRGKDLNLDFQRENPAASAVISRGRGREVARVGSPSTYERPGVASTESPARNPTRRSYSTPQVLPGRQTVAFVLALLSPSHRILALIGLHTAGFRTVSAQCRISVGRKP